MIKFNKKEYMKKYRILNREHDRLRLKKWREENPILVKAQNKRAMIKNYDYRLKYNKEWAKRNPDKVKQNSKNNYERHKKAWITRTYKNQKLRQKQFPYLKTFRSIKGRCNNLKHTTYKYYGEKGIKCLITVPELKELWFRDKAHEMKRPSIDRKNSNLDYTFENCQYIEQSENTRKSAIERWKKHNENNIRS